MAVVPLAQRLAHIRRVRGKDTGVRLRVAPRLTVGKLTIPTRMKTRAPVGKLETTKLPSRLLRLGNITRSRTSPNFLQAGGRNSPFQRLQLKSRPAGAGF